MLIYKTERQDGLADKLSQRLSIAYYSPLRASAIQPDKSSLPISVKSNLDNYGLYPIDTIMVSSGWNLNHEFFTHEELWLARKTPEDKPLNFMHTDLDIIGHITACKPVIMDFSKDEPEITGIVADDTSVDELPAEYHIQTNAVLYCCLYPSEANKAYRERMEKIVAEIPQNLWFVSMECIATHFDYALEDGDSTKIISRNDQTAFLTKYLPVYGGDGLFQGKKIGRVLRNITFIGKGIVNQPGNPNSIIFHSNLQKNNKTVYLTSAIQKIKESVMSENKEMMDMHKKLGELEVQSKASALDLKRAEENLTSKEVLITALKVDVEKHLASLKEKDKQIESLAAAKTAFEKSAEDNSKKIKELQDQLDKIQANERERNRITQWMSKTKVEEIKAKEAVAALKALSDEDFGKFLALQVEVSATAVDKTKSISLNDTDVDVVNEPNIPSLATSDKTKIEKAQADIAKYFSKQSKK